MALEPVKLDDRTWSEMVIAIRRRIAAASEGNWTLHAPVDPGVTLLELFAWLLEQRLYWMDQVPDALTRAALALLGEKTRPTQPAATVFHFRGEKLDDCKSIPALTEMRELRRQPPLIFSTDTAVTLLPIEQIELHIAGQDRTQDVTQGRVIRLFPADCNEAEIRIVLRMKKNIVATASNEQFALLFDLRTPSAIQAQWASEAPSYVPPPAKLSWLYCDKTGQRVSFKTVEDGTGGLRRTGVVRLSLPDDWQPDPSHSYSLWIRTEKAAFTAPPRLERLIPNVAIAHHQRQTREHTLTRQWLPLPGQMIVLSDLPEQEAVKDHPPLEETIQLQLRERDGKEPKGKWHEWKPVADLSFYGPDDRVFVVEREQGVLRFGDGLTGRVPVPAEAKDTNVKVKYLVGGGSAGNLGDNLKWEPRDSQTLKDLTVINVVPAEGGDELERVEAARQRVGSMLKQRHRAVIREDYEEIARTTPGVAIKRVHAAIGFHPVFPCTPVPGAVTVFIVPDAPREESDEDFVESAFIAAPVPDPGALQAVRARLGEARLITNEVFVCGPRYTKVTLVVTVESDAPGTVKLREQIAKRLREFLDPLLGGDQRQGWPFGEPLRPSVLLRETQRALGDDGNAGTVSITLVDTNIPAEDCKDVAIGPHDLISLQEVSVRFRRPAASQSARGGLR